MATFTQPINRAADLKAILDGYEQAIQKNSWLSEALQKDGIQNAWGARISARGNNWETRILYYERPAIDVPVIMLEDSGTYGLTGEVPTNAAEQITLLESEDEIQRLSRFLSSNWSVKTENALGSRGRGKMIFIGVSKTREMYFESIKSDDSCYVFGRTYLDADKTMKVEVYKGQAAHQARKEKFGTRFPKLAHIGTRIIIPNPAKEVVESITSGKLTESIQLTWWEILSKYQAKIYVGLYDNPQLVQPSIWLPIENSGLEKHKSYSNIPIDMNSSLKIKRIHLAFTQDKEAPLPYQGIAIQRGGMNIQILPISKVLSGAPEGKVFGSVEFDTHLDEEMLELESAEHYALLWNKGVAHKSLREIKKIANDFGREFKILGDERGESSKERKDAESAIQRELNEIAKSLGLKGLGFGTKQPGVKPIPQPEENIRISIPDFRAPQESGQVKIGQEVTGAVAFASSAYNEQLNVSFQVWVYREGGFNIPGLAESREGVIGKGISPLGIGWNKIIIDNRFEKGRYFLKAKLIALEDRKMDDGKVVEKGDILYREVSRPFWVEEEPPAKGFFKAVQAQAKPAEKDKYVWWEYDDGYILFYNNEHPRIKEILDDDEKYKELLLREGAMALWSIVLNNAIANPEDMDKRVLKLTESVDNESIENQVLWLLGKRSETLWGK